MSVSLNAHNIPIELFTDIAIALIAQTPLGPPSQLIPLLLTNKSFYNALSSDAFLARICKFKLDCTAIERRAFKPSNEALAGQLKKSFRFLQQLSRKFTARTLLPHYLPWDRPIESEDDWLQDVDILQELYLLRLDSDGKNYAQLEYAGVRHYVRDIVLNDVFEGCQLNDGWPVDNRKNACAMWLMWMFTLKEDLQRESPDEREILVRNVLPFCAMTHKYASSEAPPNHYHLPLVPNLRAHQTPLVHQLPTSSDPSLSPPPLKTSPQYPHYLDPARAQSFNHFDVTIPLSPPLGSIAAKLLFVARRELFHIRAPPHVLQGHINPANPFPQPSVADYERLNHVKAAKIPQWAKWDWDKGHPVRVNQPPPSPPTTTPTPAATLNPAGAVNNATAPTLLVPPAPTTTDADDEKDFEESKLWDTTWHRHRLCFDYLDPKPIFEPGKVYVPGSMDCIWEGKIWVPGLQAYGLALQPQHAAYPGPPPLYHIPGTPYPPFSERSLMMTMQFSFLDVREFVRVCGCVEMGLKCGDHPDAGEDVKMEGQADQQDEEDVEMECEDEYEDEDEDDVDQRARGLRLNEHAACGIVPVPLPVMRQTTPSTLSNSNAQLQNNAGIANNDENPTTAPMLVPNHVAPQLPPSNVQSLVPGQDGVSITDPQTGVIVPLPAGTDIDKVDFSMTNAWFPGRLGGVGVVKREGVIPSTSAPSSASYIADRDRPEEDRPRDEVVVFVNYEVPGTDKVKALDGSCASLGNSTKGRKDQKERLWVYEAYDKKRKSAHVHHGLKGGEIELVDAYIEKERKKDQVSGVFRSETELYRAAVNRAFEGRAICCLKCMEIARAKRDEKRRTDDLARKTLDDFLMNYGNSEEDGELEDIDISFSVNYDSQEPEFIPRRTSSSSSYASSSTHRKFNKPQPSANKLYPPHPNAPLIFKDDAHEDEYGSFDRSKVGVECDGVRDVILTGQSTYDRRCWGRVNIYGRVRPWDGLVGILRVSQNNDERDTYMFIFGYVVGGENFVGEWRLAMTDPTAPAFSGAFVMSRKERE